MCITPACASGRVLHWSEDEVKFECAGEPDGKQLGDRQFSLVYDVKNVAGRDDETYVVTIPDDWPQAVAAATSGAALPGRLGLRTLEPKGVRLGEGMTEQRVRVLSDADVGRRVSECFEGVVFRDHQNVAVPRLGGQLRFESGRRYTIRVYGENLAADSWVQLDDVVVGEGSQWPTRRPLAWVSLPFTFAFDLVAFVPYMVYSLATFEGPCL